ncbi:hypothetical protein Ahy_B08g090051 [Arachis hypogaea]|uniref:Transposase MuDR plant domain-containing protein n=1 Tax=Arachis hypogaea TaxID=3818 RepID=A0A444XZE8_ARAHY|nr:hypothetical protein Ahy_B08g090051 [Arachis hypogaea]
MAQQGDLGVHVGFGARDTQNIRALSEFQVGQQFQDKEEVVLSVKTYSIRRGVDYKVLESNNRKYYGIHTNCEQKYLSLVIINSKQCQHNISDEHIETINTHILGLK